MGILAVLFAYWEGHKGSKHGLKISFFLIFVFLAIRYKFGNDYMAYLDIFNYINRYGSLSFSQMSEFKYEAGWVILNYLFKPFGFFALIGVLALFNCIIYYKFIKKYLPEEYYWFAVFLYVFSPGLMLTHLTAIRQSLAILLFIFSLDYLLKKDAIRYVVCIGLASLFHFSAIILLPAYLIIFANWRNNKITSFIIISIFLSLFLYQSFFSPYLNKYIGIYFENYYDTYIGFGSAKVVSGFGVLYFAALFLLTIYYEKFQNRKTALIFKIAIISFMFIPLGMIIQFLGRVDMYFSHATIIVYPIIHMKIKNPIYKITFIALLLFVTMYTFIQFFQSGTYRTAFGTYQTIFSSGTLY